jgi:hypothetical protein
MSITLKAEEVPPVILAYLKQKLAEKGPEQTRIFKIYWPPKERFDEHGVLRDVVIGSEIIELSLDSFQDPNHSFKEIRGLESLYKTSPQDQRARAIAEGQGFSAMDQDHCPAPDACIVFKKCKEATLKRRLNGFYHITQPDCLIIGDDVYTLLDRLGVVAPDRVLHIDAVSGETGEKIGMMHLFDPEIRADLIDLEKSRSRWMQGAEGEWIVASDHNPFDTSYLPDKSITIARADRRSGCFILSKDLIYTLQRHGVKLPKHNQHKVYFGHDYKPKDLFVEARQA